MHEVKSGRALGVSTLDYRTLTLVWPTVGVRIAVPCHHLSLQSPEEVADVHALHAGSDKNIHAVVRRLKIVTFWYIIFCCFFFAQDLAIHINNDTIILTLQNL